MPWFLRRKEPASTPPPPREGRGRVPDGPQTTTVGARRYYSDVPYVLPKDLEDGNRLDFQHYFFRQAMRGYYLAPLEPENVSSILDVGCGTGRWPIEMAQLLPHTQVMGLDLEPLQQQGAEHVPNYHFTRGNILQGLPFPHGMFDFVHQRLLVMGIPLAQWTTVIRELLRVTAPGGWVELVEGGNTLYPAGPYTQHWFDWGMQLSKPHGIDPSKISFLGQYAQEAGMRNCQTIPFDLPVGNWGGRIGLLLQRDFQAIYESLRPRYQAQLGISEGIIKETLPGMLAEWEHMHTRFRFYVVIGQP